ncbi:recombination regulator RecX, partial [Stenotrophomonas maltophilia]
MSDADDIPNGRKRRPREQTPVQRALGLLVRREHSRKELTRKLTARGIEDDAAQAAVAKLTEAGWQDDTRFAENLVRMRANTGYGPIHVRAELGTHGLDSAAIEDDAAQAAVAKLTEAGWQDDTRFAENLVRMRA